MAGDWFNATGINAATTNILTMAHDHSLGGDFDIANRCRLLIP
jgi:hypothetical protein